MGRFVLVAAVTGGSERDCLNWCPDMSQAVDVWTDYRDTTLCGRPTSAPGINCVTTREPDHVPGGGGRSWRKGGGSFLPDVEG